VNQVIARSLNDYGGTFPSAYELLPRLSLDCDAKWTTPPVVMKTGGVDSPIRNIFHVDLWKNYNWPKGPYPKAPAARKKFLEANLAKFLNNANELTCTLARYDIDKEFTVTRFYGSDLDTDCSVIVGATGWRGEHTLEFTSCPGDGTVPVESANERRNDGRRLPGGHLDMLSSDAFISALSELYNKNMQALDLAYAKATGTDRGPVELRAELDLIIPPNPNPASEAEKAASDTTRRTNDEVVKRRDEQKGLPPGTTASRIYKDARDKQKSKDPLVRANGYRVAAELEGTNPQRRAWALNNSADISFEQEDYSKAKALALKALQEADAVQRKHAGLRADMRRLTGLAAWTVAVSSKKLGQSNDVDRYTRLAIQNGNPKARRIQI
jgi:hypothetical protein